MTRTLRLTNDADSFTQGLASENIEIRIFALGGADQINLNRSDDFGGGNFVDAGLGNDTVQCGDEDGNLILLGGGADVYFGLGFGSFATEAPDTVQGGSGADTFVFETFKSSYLGGDGNDLFRSVGEANFINGGAGVDTVSYDRRSTSFSQGDTGVTINLAAQLVQTGAIRTETLRSIENAIGSSNDDVIIGSNGANRLTGGGGIDALQGGGGADRFVFLALSDAEVFSDVAEEIVDFDRSQNDRIDLSAIDAKTGVAGNQAFIFKSEGDFTGTKGELVFLVNQPGQMLVGGDVNGDRVTDFQFLVDGVSTLLSGDFIL